MKSLMVAVFALFFAFPSPSVSQTPGEISSAQEHDLYDFVRVLKHFRNKFDSRSEDENFVGGGGPYTLELRASYRNLNLLARVYIEEITFSWRRLRSWADQYAGIPDGHYDAKIVDATVARLRRVMATTTTLAPAICDAGFTNENFQNTGSLAARYYDMLDRFVEMAILLAGRAQHFVDAWEAQGTGDRALEARTIFLELLGASAYGRNRIANEATRIKDVLGASITDRRLRREYIASAAVNGGFCLLSPGSRPTDEVDPGIDTTATFPALGTDPS